MSKPGNIYWIEAGDDVLMAECLAEGSGLIYRFTLLSKANLESFDFTKSLIHASFRAGKNWRLVGQFDPATFPIQDIFRSAEALPISDILYPVAWRTWQIFLWNQGAPSSSLCHEDLILGYLRNPASRIEELVAKRAAKSSQSGYLAGEDPEFELEHVLRLSGPEFTQAFEIRLQAHIQARLFLPEFQWRPLHARLLREWRQIPVQKPDQAVELIPPGATDHPPRDFDLAAWRELYDDERLELLRRQPEIGRLMPAKQEVLNWFLAELTHHPFLVDVYDWSPAPPETLLRLLPRNPRLFASYPVERWEAEHWLPLLRINRDWANCCSRRDFSPADWVKVLKLVPEWRSFCPFEKLSREEKLLVLSAHPDWRDLFDLRDLRKAPASAWLPLLSKDLNWLKDSGLKKLDSRTKCILAQHHDQYFLALEKSDYEEMNNSLFCEDEWLEFLRFRPQALGYCRCLATLMSSSSLPDLLAAQASLAADLPLASLPKRSWLSWLQIDPSAGQRPECPWTQFSPDDWLLLLMIQPVFAERCPWNELTSPFLGSLLGIHPELMRHRPPASLSPAQWAWLLPYAPHLEEKAPIALFRGEGLGSACRKKSWIEAALQQDLNAHDWDCILAVRPQMLERCPAHLLSSLNQEALLLSHPDIKTSWLKLRK